MRLVPALLAISEQLLDVRRNRAAFLLHACDRLLDAGSVPQLERTHLPIEAEMHGTIDLNDVVGDLAHAVRGVVPQIGQDSPQELRDRILLRVAAQQHAQALGVRIDILRHVERGELWLLLRTILQRLPINAETSIFSVGTTLLL